MWNQPNGDNMGYYKNLAIEEQQRQEQEDQEAQKQIEEYKAAQQEAYYWYVLQEFMAVCKVMSLKKVYADLKTLREHTEGVVLPKVDVKEEPRIITDY